MEQDFSAALAETPSLSRLIAAIENIAALLGALHSRVEESSTWLTKEQLATRLNVSTRWIERYITPSLRAKKGGRSWYDEEHVKTQLERGAFGPARVRNKPKRLNPKTQAIEADLRKHKARTKAVST